MKGKTGQAVIEFALVLPFLLLLILNLVNFGALLYACLTVANAARAGAQYMVLAGASLGAPAPPTAAQVASVVTQDVSSLPNQASLQVKVCTNNNGTVGCSGSGGGAPLTDPEPTHYVVGTVDVTYTYQPLLGAWRFPNLGIYLTIPPSTIHRRAAMRMLQ